MDHLELREPDRIRDRTTRTVKDRIDAQTRVTLADAEASGPGAIRYRLRSLDREWDIDRALMANFAILGGASFLTGVTQRKRFWKKGNGWLYLFGTQLSFLLMHAVFGWCPPFEVFRRLGVRSAREIEAERHALLARLGGESFSPSASTH